MALADGPLELIPGTHEPLAPGRYRRSGFDPPITFAIGPEDGGRWLAVQGAAGFFDIQQGVLTPDVIAVQFARPTAFAGSGGASLPATDVAAAIAALRANEGLTVVETSPAAMAARSGAGATLDHAGTGEDFQPVLEVAAGPISIGPGRRLWLGLFDLEGAGDGGIVACLVLGSVARWTEAVRAAAPILESVTFGQTDQLA